MGNGSWPRPRAPGTLPSDPSVPCSVPCIGACLSCPLPLSRPAPWPHWAVLLGRRPGLLQSLPCRSPLPPPETPFGIQGPEPQGPVAKAARAPGEEHVASGGQAGKPPPTTSRAWGPSEAAGSLRGPHGRSRGRQGQAGHRTGWQTGLPPGVSPCMAASSRRPWGQPRGWAGRGPRVPGWGVPGQTGWPPGAHTQGLPKVTSHEGPQDDL